MRIVLSSQEANLIHLVQARSPCRGMEYCMLQGSSYMPDIFLRHVMQEWQGENTRGNLFGHGE